MLKADQPDVYWPDFLYTPRSTTQTDKLYAVSHGSWYWMALADTPALKSVHFISHFKQKWITDNDIATIYFLMKSSTLFRVKWRIFWTHIKFGITWNFNFPLDWCLAFSSISISNYFISEEAFSYQDFLKKTSNVSEKGYFTFKCFQWWILVVC